MRAMHSKNGIRIKAYAGTTGVMLVMDVTQSKRKGLLGFAIEREGPGAKHRWLKGLLRFPGEEVGEYLTPVDSKVAPIQKFRWSDYSVYPSTRYTYRVHGVYAGGYGLKYKKGGEVSVVTEPLYERRHQVIFNRAVAASQAYSRRFGGVNPDEPGNEAARDWLSRGLREKLLSFIGRADSESWALDVAIYEIELPEVVAALRHAHSQGARVRVLYHAKTGDHQTEVNEEHLGPLPEKLKKGRETSKIFHQKFVVLSLLGEDGARSPVSVLSGSTNFTPNGVYRQANVIHVVEDPGLAAEYLALFEHIHAGATPSETRTYINENNPITDLAEQVLFSPRSGLVDLDEIASVVDDYTHSDLIFCTAFKLHEKIRGALRPKKDGLVRYGLQNRKSTITGIHRNAEFTVPAYLKGGLEGFLKESTAGQKGSIYIHLKAILCDFTRDDPVIISGSHNLSAAGSKSNDENMLVLWGDTSVADSYLCEMFRFYDHYRFRYNVKKDKGAKKKKLALVTDDSWTNPYFKEGSFKSVERVRFSR